MKPSPIRAILLASALFYSSVASSEAPTDAHTVAPLSSEQAARDTVRVAAVQLTITSEDLGEGQDVVDVLAPYMARARRDGAELVVFPEYLFGPFKIPGPLVDRFLAAAKSHGVNAIVGGWEYLPGHEIQHPPEPGTYANTLIVASREGALLGTYRKTHAAIGAPPHFWPATPGELGENTMVLGEEHPVIDMDFGRVGLLTCYDGYFWPSFEIPSLRGAEILVWVNARGGIVEPHITQAASFMTATHIVATNQGVGAGTQIVAYPANIQALLTEAGEGYITAKLNLTELRQNRRNNRMLHQRRPDLYKDLAEPWRPWDAYPEIPPFQYPETATPTTPPP